MTNTLELPPFEVAKRSADRRTFRRSISTCEMDAEDIILISALRAHRKDRKAKKLWIKGWLAKRATHGAFAGLFRELRSETEQSDFHNFVRMDIEQFDYLVAKIGPKIRKVDTNMRAAISPEERLAVTLRFLASGDSYQSLHYLYRLGRSTIGEIIPETCQAIVDSLKEEFLKVPTTQEEWREVSEQFEQRWQLPHCLGAIDGKHIAMKAPANSGSVYFNYKEYYSIVLMAIVDSDYRFIWYQIGDNGRQNDAGIFNACALSSALDNNSLNFPPSEMLGQVDVPFFFVGDEAFPLKETLMKPYPQRGLTDSQAIFNYRLSRGRRVVENAFGILSQRFRVLSRPINLMPDVVSIVTESCLALHNFLKAKKDMTYCQVQSGSSERMTERMTDRVRGTFYTGNHSADRARQTRENLKHYFIGEGQVPFQWKQISCPSLP